MMLTLWISILMMGWPVSQPPAQPAKQELRVDSRQSSMPYIARLVGAASEAQPKTLDEAIRLALVHHPDIRVAEAELRVAEAKLAQVRLQVTQKVSSEYALLQQAKGNLESLETQLQHVQKQHKEGVAPKGQLDQKVVELARYKAGMANQELAWRGMLGATHPTQQCTQCHQGIASEADYRRHHLQDLVRFLSYDLKITEAGKSSTPSDAANIGQVLSQHLETRIKLDTQKQIELEPLFAKLGAQLGKPFRVRLPITENKELYRHITKLDLEAAEMPLHTWLQLIMDEMNNVQVLTNDKPKRYDLYLREYGLLLTPTDLAPSDARTVQSFYQQWLLQRANSQTNQQQPKKE